MKSDLVDCHAVEHREDEDVLLSEGRVRSPLSRAEEVGLNDLVHVWIDFGASLGSRSPIGTQFNFSENFRRPTLRGRFHTSMTTEHHVSQCREKQK